MSRNEKTAARETKTELTVITYYQNLSFCFQMRTLCSNFLIWFFRALPPWASSSSSFTSRSLHWRSADWRPLSELDKRSKVCDSSCCTRASWKIINCWAFSPLKIYRKHTGGYSYSSDGDGQRIFLGLKILIPKYFLGRNIWQVLFSDGVILVGIFWGCQNNQKIRGNCHVSRPRSSANKV